MIQNVPVLMPIPALAVAAGCIWLLHKAANHRITGKYINDTVLTYVTSAILIYVLCIWVIGNSLLWVFHSYYWPSWLLLDV